jgi:hypothetical protein
MIQLSYIFAIIHSSVNDLLRLEAFMRFLHSTTFPRVVRLIAFLMHSWCCSWYHTGMLWNAPNISPGKVFKDTAMLMTMHLVLNFYAVNNHGVFLIIKVLKIIMTMILILLLVLLRNARRLILLSSCCNVLLLWCKSFLWPWPTLILVGISYPEHEWRVSVKYILTFLALLLTKTSIYLSGSDIRIRPIYSWSNGHRQLENLLFNNDRRI